MALEEIIPCSLWSACIKLFGSIKTTHSLWLTCLKTKAKANVSVTRSKNMINKIGWFHISIDCLELFIDVMFHEIYRSQSLWWIKFMDAHHVLCKLHESYWYYGGFIIINYVFIVLKNFPYFSPRIFEKAFSFSNHSDMCKYIHTQRGAQGYLIYAVFFCFQRVFRTKHPELLDVCLYLCIIHIIPTNSLEILKSFLKFLNLILHDGLLKMENSAVL